MTTDRKSTAFVHDQYDQLYPAGIEHTYWHVARHLTIGRALRAHLAPGSKLVEVGCGAGVVTRYLRSLGYDVVGTDLGAAPGARGVPYLFPGTKAEDLPGPIRLTAQALLLFDVIEHVEDAPGMLKSLLDAFPNARYVLLTVPSRKELWSSFDDHFGHFRRYDRPMLRRELKEAGMEPVSMKYFFHGLYMAIGLNNLLRGGQRNIRFRPPGSAFARMRNRVLGRAMYLEGALLPDGLAGSSIICMAERR